MSFVSKLFTSTQFTSDEHSDKERRGVGWTAFAVALLRAFETTRLDRKPIIQDKLAIKLFDFWNGSAPFHLRLYFFIGFFLLLLFKRSRILFLVMYPLRKLVLPIHRLLDMMALRTKFIDERVNKFIIDCRQIVIVGAGLDTRSFRLAALGSSNIKIYEIDFAGMLKEKQRLFAAANFSYYKNDTNQVPDRISRTVIPVATDLTQSAARWQHDLKAVGFEIETPTIWLLEGLTGYLTNFELNKLLAGISELSTQNSKMIATWLGTKRKHLRAGATKMHHTFTDDPDEFLVPFGWKQDEKLSLGAIAERYRITGNIDPEDVSYWITCHKKK